MAISEAFLSMLVCPVDRQQLVLASPETVALLNDAIASRALKTVHGEDLTAPLDGALVTLDGHNAYPIIAGVPHLLKSSRISLS
ncbi:MAG: hypothetical protein VX589_15300 [Myxococcota bacterium]|nr:hypothetical protein [Myxococcota bacterium]